MKSNRPLHHRSRAGTASRSRLHVLWAMLASALVIAGCAGPVTDPVDGFALDVDQDTVAIAPGGSATLDLGLTRIAPFADAVTVTVDGLPAGVTADTPITIAEDEATAVLTLTAAADAPLVENHTLEVVATAGALEGRDTVLVTVDEEGTVPPTDGEPGTPDESLNGTGTALYGLGSDLSEVHDIEVLGDGSIVLAGTATDDPSGTPTHHVAVARVSAGGTLVTDFGTDGFLTSTVAGEIEAMDVEVQGDWLLVAYVVNGTTHDIVIERYDLMTGAMDTGFGNTGEALTLDAVTDVTVTDAGLVYVTGYGDDPGTATDGDSDFVVYRFDATGTLDDSFFGGVRYIDQGPEDEAHGVVELADGSVIVYGASNVGAVDADLVAIRLTDAGGIDFDFGPADARITHDFAGFFDVAQAGATHDDHVVLAANTASDVVAEGSNVGLVRFDAAGVLDTAFGTDGEVQYDFGGDEDVVAVETQADGGIVVLATRTMDDGSTQMLLIRFTAAGDLDTTFGADGVVVADFGADAEANALALTDERILVGGEAGGDAALGAYWR